MKYQNMKALFDELKNRYDLLEKEKNEPIRIYKPVEMVAPSVPMPSLAENTTVLMDMYKDKNKEMVKPLVFNLLYYYRQYIKQLKAADHCKLLLTSDKRLNDCFKSDYIDKLRKIYKRMERRIVLFLKEIFERSVDSASHTKK